MKKVLRYLVMTVMAICFAIPGINAAEAATVALLPLVNNVPGDELANQVFYKQAMAVLNSKKGFVMVENDKLTAVIEKETAAGSLPSEAALQAIAKNGDVDIVIAMQLDTLEDNVIMSSEENKLQLDLQGYAVAYNRLTGKFYKHRIYSDKTVPEALTARWDWVHEEWGRSVRLEMDRILSGK